MSIYDTLNKEQQDACFHTEGPLLILAGAGSGKTRVITHRICYLIDEKNVNPWNILAITFTNKAAGEMRERVDKLVGFGAESIWVSTFHSMCVRILRRHIGEIGYDTGFAIYDSDDQKTLMRQCMKTLNINPKELREKTVLNAISSAKDKLQTPLKFAETHQKDFQEKQIASLYEEYQRQLHSNNALDFDDLLMKTVELFHSHQEILENYQERFRYIMVDEYQDTNMAQFELIRLLADKYRTLCVVGDDDQSIYKFRGADVRNILDFESVYKDAQVVKLEQNYR
ncbi:MAG: UvrD-helicase domain-containing protein, partial [Lachnospiraceae bacterium]|nr:UvrD-helicase domain-containing protein [Lachnospiraceae bacterium]